MANFTAFLIVLILFPIGHAQFIPSIGHESVPSITTRASRPTCRAALAECLKSLDSGEPCKLLPIPTGALQAFPPPGEFFLRLLRKNVWMYSDGNYLSLIMTAPNRLAVIDMPDSFGSSTNNGTGTLLTDAVDRVLAGMIPKRIDMVYSHAHFDHIGGSRRFFTYAKNKYPTAKFFIWGTMETKELVKASSTNRAVTPNVIVKERGKTLKLGKGLEARMTIVGGHTQEDLMIHLPRVRNQPSILYFLDVVFPKWAMPTNLAITQDVRALINAHKEILKVDFDILVPGHIRTGNKGDVRTNLEYLQDLVRITGRARRSITPQRLAEAGFLRVQDRRELEFGNVWYVLNLLRELATDVCYREMIEKWGCRLAAADVFLRSNCLMGVIFHSTEA